MTCVTYVTCVTRLPELLQAIRSLGVITNQSDDDPTRDLEFWRFFLRDTGAREAARQESKAFFDTRKAQRQDDQRRKRPTRKLAAIPPSLIFFWRVIGLLRGLCATLGAKVCDVRSMRNMRNMSPFQQKQNLIVCPCM